MIVRASEERRDRRGTTGPLVSIIVPCFNGHASIDAAVRSCRDQTIGDFEVLVIDDGSGRPVGVAPELAADPRVSIVRHPRNLGVSAARNTGLALARGEIVALLDCDDRWEPGHLAAALAQLERTGADLVYGQARLTGHPYGQAVMYDPATLEAQPVRRLADLAVNNPIITSTVVMRAEIARRAGGWPEHMRIGEDWWLYLRVLNAGGAFAVQRCPLVTYEWPTTTAHASSRQWRILWDRLKLVWMIRRTWPQAEVPTWRVAAEPAYRFLVAMLPWAVRRALRNRVAGSPSPGARQVGA